MTIRRDITEYLSTLKNNAGQEEKIANNILDIIENTGLELTEWREDTGIERWTLDIYLKSLELKASHDCLAISVLFLLEDNGLSLSGNGWLDNDPIASKIIDEIYDAISTPGCEKIETIEYQAAFKLTTT